MTLLVACGGGGSSGSSSDAGAGDAFKRQANYLADGQYQRAYEEIHPAEQALFTADQYAKCLSKRDVGSLELSSINIKETFQESITIPGTNMKADSTAHHRRARNQSRHSEGHVPRDQG